MSVNKAILVGRLGQDPKVRTTEGGKKVVSFSVATDETYKKDGEKIKDVEWHNIIMWNKLADVAEEYLHKGDLVYVEGRIKTRQWTDREGGTKQTTEVIANVMRMLGGNTKAAAAGGDDSEESPF